MSPKNVPFDHFCDDTIKAVPPNEAALPLFAAEHSWRPRVREKDSDPLRGGKPPIQLSRLNEEIRPGNRWPCTRPNVRDGGERDVVAVHIPIDETLVSRGAAVIDKHARVSPELRVANERHERPVHRRRPWVGNCYEAMPRKRTLDPGSKGDRHRIWGRSAPFGRCSRNKDERREGDRDESAKGAAHGITGTRLTRTIAKRPERVTRRI